MRLARALGAAAVLLALTGCGALADPPPEAAVPPVQAPPRTPLDPSVETQAQATVPVLASESAERRARRQTVRVRNTGCEGISTGSGFALDETTLITNRHVLAGADELEVSTWDGRTFTVNSAEVGRLGDLGIATVSGALPEQVRLGPAVARGDRVRVVGYPLGGELTINEGTVVDRVAGERFGIPGEVLRLTATVMPGNSGGPVFDAEGRIAGVVFAIELATRLALAIPAETLQELVASGDLEGLPPCGSQ